MKLEKIVDELNRIPQFMPLTGVERARIMFKAMGNPEKKLKVIHVAGTNGKGSVCAYLDSILRAQGYKVGLFTSPHLLDIRERIKIDGQMIPGDDFVSGYMAVKEAADAAGIELAYFDYLLGIAVLAFVKANMDYCVIETGLGGRLDATNAIEDKLLNVITGVSLEHTAILGDTVEKIAAEKAGIIDNGVPVVFMDKDKRVAQVIRQRACQVGSDAVEVNFNGLRIIKNTGKSIDFSVHNRYYMNDCFAISTGAQYQAENCLVALTAVACLNDAGKAGVELQTMVNAVKNTYWAGRMEEVADRVYVDGAHNPEGIEALIKSASAIAAGQKSILFFSVVNDKDYRAMIEMLCRSDVFDSYVVTQIEGNRKLSGQRIKDIFAEYTDKDIREFDSVEEGYGYARRQSAKEDAYCFCTGSLYLVGDIKALGRDGGNYD